MVRVVHNVEDVIGSDIVILFYYNNKIC